VTQVNVFDAGVCSLGEGALWHPTRNQFFWFDINNNALFSQDEGTRIRWDFDANVTAAGWVNDTQLIIAHETSLLLFNVETRESEKVVDLEAADPITRSNDGRADPWGGILDWNHGQKTRKRCRCHLSILSRRIAHTISAMDNPECTMFFTAT
jgi:sugar lactone lactonase YvrE